jgi:glutathione peroxidase-family protein
MTKADPDWDKKSDIKWSFTKFVVDREGNVNNTQKAAAPCKSRDCGLFY